MLAALGLGCGDKLSKGVSAPKPNPQGETLRIGLQTEKNYQTRSGPLKGFGQGDVDFQREGKKRITEEEIITQGQYIFKN